MRRPKIDKGKNISSENVEEATRMFLNSGGKIKKLPPDIPFDLYDLEKKKISTEGVQDETSSHGHQENT